MRRTSIDSTVLESDEEVVKAFFQQKIVELQEIVLGYANAIEEMKRAVGLKSR
ncbi:hypothetical protein [Paenibacillus tyrfis]|uniref:hypothetical protein n=1 Tax=Paenibacillus tyrfis TaxID=1501230 RepID=UPI0015C60A5C|nr:hypothetical protein [Paenibacillus tyrfis]